MIEIDLIKCAQTGNQDAMSEILKKYKPFVIMRAKKYYLFDGENDDLIQEGMIGLLKAIKAYDPNREASFDTFATICIKRQIITAINKSNSNRNKIFRLSTKGILEEEDNISYISKSLIYYNPEELFFGKDKLENLKSYLNNNLSKMEKEVFNYMLLGYNYIEISKKTGRTSKTVDNSIQRIKKKINSTLNYY